MSKLPAKQRRFVEEYLVDLNGKQAAIRAGYAAKSAHVQGCRLRMDANVAAAIREQMNERAARLQLTRDSVVFELARLAFANTLQFIKIDPRTGEATVDLSAIGPDEAAAIQELTSDVYLDGTGEVKSTKIKLHGKVPALQLLGKHLGMFTDKLEVDINHRMVPLDRLSPKLKMAIAAELQQLEDDGEIRPLKVIEGGRR